MSACLSGGLTPWCQSVGGRGLIDIECRRWFSGYIGHMALVPLTCVGPITVEVEVAAHFSVNRYPLYVEIVPLPEWDDFPCGDPAPPGRVVLVAYGDLHDSCGTWVRRGPMDITSVVPLGSRYSLRFYFFGRYDVYMWSPYIDCIRVTAHPAGTTRVQPVSWGMVKSLYRE
jgi:hypothetical protein